MSSEVFCGGGDWCGAGVVSGNGKWDRGEHTHLHFVDTAQKMGVDGLHSDGVVGGDDTARAFELNCNPFNTVPGGEVASGTRMLLTGKTGSD